MSKTCLLKGSGSKMCERHFQQKLAEGQVHIITEHGKELVHKVGHTLYEGNTPVGKRLNEFKEYPGYILNKGIDKNEVVNLPENLEIIKIRLEGVGPAGLFNHALDATQLLF